MANTGFKSPTLGTSVLEAPYDDNTWSNPTNIYASDNADASVTAVSYDLLDYTYVLKATGFDFSSIPAGSTINGVVVRIEAANGTGADAVDAVVQLLDASRARVGTNKATSLFPSSTTDATQDYGGAADLWGNALTEAWVKDPDFGVGIVFQADSNNAKIYVDHVQMDVYYTAPSAAYPDVKVGGAWKPVTATKVKVSGAWKDVTAIKVKVSGAWKDLA